MKCPTCQHELPDTTLMCPYCGYAKCEPPSDVPHLLAELQRLLTYFSHTTEPLHRKRSNLWYKITESGEFTTGGMGCFTIILMMIVLFIVWGLLIVLQFFHMNFAILLCTFLEKYIGWNNLFWFCILVPILFNIINRIRLRIKKRCWKKELEEVYQNLDSAFFQTPNNFIEFRYARVEIIKYLIEYIQTGRASSYKEALNLFLDNFYPPQPSLHDKYYDPFDSVYYVKSYKQKY